METPGQNEIYNLMLPASENMAEIIKEGQKGAARLNTIKGRTDFLKALESNLQIFRDDLEHRYETPEEKQNFLQAICNNCSLVLGGLGLTSKQKNLCKAMLDDLKHLGQDGEISKDDIANIGDKFITRLEQIILADSPFA